MIESLRVGLLDKIRASIGETRDSRETPSAARDSNLPEVPPATRLSQPDILAELIRYLVGREDQELQAEDVDSSANIFDYGYVDSLDIIAFIAFIEQRFSVHILDEDLVTRFTTLDALAQHVAESSSELDPSVVHVGGSR